MKTDISCYWRAAPGSEFLTRWTHGLTPTDLPLCVSTCTGAILARSQMLHALLHERAL